jgi:hypothetical protein
MSNASTRVNLAIPLDLAIQIEKECDKRGINRTQFIKEVLIKEDVNEIKRILLLLVELNQK